MRAVVFHGERTIEVADVPDPSPGPGEVVIAVSASGMCGSDLHTYRGARRDVPVIAGHEPAGAVVAIGAGVPGSWLDTAVMVHHYIGCGRCDQCRQGWTQMCRNGASAMGDAAPGSHAAYVRMPLDTVVARPEGLSDLAAAAISCGTGTAWNALRRLQLSGADTIAIFGQGPVGLAATQIATAMGARVIATDISATRLARAEAFGAWATLNPADVASIPDAIRELTGGRGVPKCLETSGASSAANDALHALDLWGVACWVGVGSRIEFALTEHLYKQITAFPSWTLPVPAMEACARFVVERDIDVDAIFTDVWRLDQAVEAYELFDRQATGKGAFVP